MKKLLTVLMCLSALPALAAEKAALTATLTPVANTFSSPVQLTLYVDEASQPTAFVAVSENEPVRYSIVTTQKVAEGTRYLGQQVDGIRTLTVIESSTTPRQWDVTLTNDFIVNRYVASPR